MSRRTVGISAASAVGVFMFFGSPALAVASPESLAACIEAAGADEVAGQACYDANAQALDPVVTPETPGGNQVPPVVPEQTPPVVDEEVPAPGGEAPVENQPAPPNEEVKPPVQGGPDVPPQPPVVGPPVNGGPAPVPAPGNGPPPNSGPKPGENGPSVPPKDVKPGGDGHESVPPKDTKPGTVNVGDVKVEVIIAPSVTVHIGDNVVNNITVNEVTNVNTTNIMAGDIQYNEVTVYSSEASRYYLGYYDGYGEFHCTGYYADDVRTVPDVQMASQNGQVVRELPPFNLATGAPEDVNSAAQETDSTNWALYGVGAAAVIVVVAGVVLYANRRKNGPDGPSDMPNIVA